MKDLDKIEKFVRENKSAFDDAVPDNKVWDHITNALDESTPIVSSEKRTVVRYMSRVGKRWMSAAAVLLIAVSLAAFIRTYQVKTQMEDNAIPADLRDAQAYYESKISSKIETITAISGRQNVDTSLFHLLGERDAEYDRIRQDLHSNPGNPHVRSAFVEYYRSRLEVLNRMEDHLKKTK